MGHGWSLSSTAMAAALEPRPVPPMLRIVPAPPAGGDIEITVGVRRNANFIKQPISHEIGRGSCPSEMCSRAAVSKVRGAIGGNEGGAATGGAGEGGGGSAGGGANGG
eukprot:2871723-Prymnesium_polylepis.2